MLTRRDFLKAVSFIALSPTISCAQMAKTEGTLVNDIHSQLNPTLVDRVVAVDSIDVIRRTIRSARREGKTVSIAGGRHAMGGQQFGTGTVLLDTTKLTRVLNFNLNEGTIEVEAGIQWPELIQHLITVQEGRPRQWGIAQKQTGADRLSIGGAIGANVHGRGLRMRPFIADVESFVLVDAHGNILECSRRENAELFRLVNGGYGLFGTVCAVTLRLAPRRKVQRVVEVISIEKLMPAFEKRIADGFLFGDFQYSTDKKSKDFMRKGVFSCYRPVDPVTPIPAKQKKLSDEDWRNLLYLSHADKGRAFERYADYYLSTSGQVYWSDTNQLSTYFDDYHKRLDLRLGAAHKATEIITEIYVPRQAIVKFMAEVSDDFRKNDVEPIYGTIRLIERDEESFLAWAKQAYACIIFNLHAVHTPEGLEHTAHAFRRLIDIALRLGGSYYLTYHKYATRNQVLACYPQFPEFLRLKKKYDPEERFQSNWYRYYKKMFADVL